MALVGTLGWLMLARFSSSYTTLLCVLTWCAASLAFTDVITDALMVETGRPLRLTGSFQAIQWASVEFRTDSLAQFLGGYLAAYVSVQNVFLLTAGFPLALIIVTFSLVHEPPVASSASYFY